MTGSRAGINIRLPASKMCRDFLSKGLGLLIFARQKLVLLSVPKTGSTAYEEALTAHAAISVMAPPELKHSPVFRYNRYFRPMVERFAGPEADIVAVMREPIAWLGSWYRYRSRDALAGHPQSTRDIGFDAFVAGYCRGDQPVWARVGSQARFLEPQRNGTRVSHLFRYEDQAGFREFLEARLGVEIAPGTWNRSPARDLELTERTETRLRRKYARDFALYASIRPDGAYTFPVESLPPDG